MKKKIRKYARKVTKKPRKKQKKLLKKSHKKTKSAKKYKPRKLKLTKPALLKRIKKCVDEEVRPLLQMDGGDIEVVGLGRGNVLKVRLCGACRGCMAASYTLQYGVQEAINRAFPDEDIKVMAVE